MKATIKIATVVEFCNGIRSVVEKKRAAMLEERARKNLSRYGFWKWLFRRPRPNPTDEAIKREADRLTEANKNDWLTYSEHVECGFMASETQYSKVSLMLSLCQKAAREAQTTVEVSEEDWRWLGM